MVQQNVSPDWLVGGGEMGALIRAMDWSNTPLGPVDGWPQSLRTTVSLCLSSTFPILIAWGPERVQIYNDAYRPICGELHPRSMGQRFNECWATALPAVGHILDRAQSGEGSYIENLPMELDRYGYLEEAFMTFSFSPIRDESGRVGGLFHPITEVTEKMLSARRNSALRELAASLGEAKSIADIGERLEAMKPRFELDAPFVQCYELTSGQRLAGREIALDVWPREAAVIDVEVACGPYPEPVRQAIVMPLQPPGSATPVLLLVAGVSVRRELDVGYRAFFDQIASTVNSALANVLAYEQEQQRVRALAEIDRAKTAFFSNVSHEFRTPLTLMLGPLEDALADASVPLPQAHRERMLLVQRSGMRLLKLVNTLLDFSRIEAGRVQASFQETELAALTRDLASVFRSTVEKAGLALHVACETTPEPAWVDREMWEKIVLNLLSNAFKHTLAGSIHVALVAKDGTAQLTVADTGVGIPATELPRLFERFHRVQGARGRSYEGSGIGLALVQELVKLHGGGVHVESELGRGTTFTVSLPLGHAHLPSERLNADRNMQSTATRAEAFVNEASGWIGEPPAPAEALPKPTVAPRDLPRVVLADDNADMRDYVRRLLADYYRVEAVNDGHAALDATRRELPALVLTDVMMPGLDGFGLLRTLKAAPETANVPVILLSARAGEEATLEGLQAGASDYMVKPFSARELLARIEGTLRAARAEQERLQEVQKRAEFSQQLIGIVSHDLRNPLNVVLLSALHLLKREELDHGATTNLRRIQRAAERAVRLVRDLLDFTQARLGGGIPVVKRAVDLSELIEQVLMELRASHPERELRFETDDSAAGEWDSDRIAQVVHNLVSNAIKYGEGDVWVRVRSRDRLAQLEVHNRGEPIAPALLPYVFEPMVRGRDQMVRHAGSIGLGLFIVQQLVHSHGGQVTVRSSPNDGTTFTVELPLQA